MNEKKLKLGIFLDSYEVPAWAYTAIEKIVNLHFVEISLIILNESPDICRSKIDKYWNNRSQIVYSVFNKIDEVLFRGKPDAFKLHDLKKILSAVPAIKVRPIQKRYSDYIQPEDIERIDAYNLDILIRMGFRILRGDILNCSKYGIWSYHHGDNRVNRGRPPGFWETLESWPETGSTLQILNETLGGGKVLYRSWSLTYRLSPYKNRSLYFWTSSTFLPRQIECLHRLGEERFFKEIEKFNEEFDFYSHKLYKVPSNIMAIPLMVRYLARIILEVYNKIFRLDHWYLMFDLGQDVATSFYGFREIVPPKDRFWADPHVIQNNHKYYIFVEEYIYKNKKAHISVIEMDEQGDFKEPVRVLEKDYHLSYPFVFEWEGKYYMVPETMENRTIELYECINFPYDWIFRMNLMENVKAVDTTLFYKDEKWWLFAAMSESEGPGFNSELFIFFSNELFTSKWKPHPLNPVISDVKRARPAGRIFVKNGKIFRPSQNNSVAYGYGFNINKIVRLSETEYVERQVVSIKPNWDKGVQGTHTFANEGRLTIIDAHEIRHKNFGFHPKRIN